MRHGEGESFSRGELSNRHAQHFTRNGIENGPAGVARVERRAQRPTRRVAVLGEYRTQPAVGDDVLEPLSVAPHSGTADHDDFVAVLMLEPTAKSQRRHVRVDRQKREVVFWILRHERHWMPRFHLGDWIKKLHLEILDGIVGNNVVIGDEEPGRQDESGAMPDAAGDNRRRTQGVADGVT